MEKPPGPSELIGKYILIVIIWAIAWPILASIFSLFVAVIFNWYIDGTAIIIMIVIPYKLWWLSLSLIALWVWRKNILYYFNYNKQDKTYYSTGLGSNQNDVKSIYGLEYECNGCKKKLYEDDNKYSHHNKIYCSSCLNKIKKETNYKSNEKLPSKHIKVDRELMPKKQYPLKHIEGINKYPQESKEEKTKESITNIHQFFKSLEHTKIDSAPMLRIGTILENANYNLFQSFIFDTKKSLSILCWRVDEKLLSEMLWPIKDKQIKIRVITKNRINKGYLEEFKNYCPNLDLVHRNKIHCKIIIKDEQKIIIGSSNITDASMSKTGYFLDCNSISDNKITVQDAINLFESVYNKKDYMKKIEGSKLRYTRNNQTCLPFSLKSFFEKETEEIVLLFSCDMVDMRIIDRIIEWNPRTPISLYVGDSFKKSQLSIDNLNSMKWLYDASINDYKNIKVIPVKDSIHAKLYLFKKQQIGFVSSQNLTVESWQSLLEAGIIIDNVKEFQYLYSSINLLKKSSLNKIELGDLEKTTQPESLFSGNEIEKNVQIPWDLPEVNLSWKIQRRRGQEYFNLIKNKINKKKEEANDNFWEGQKSVKTYKNPLIEEIEKRHLLNQAITGLYSRPTRSILTGKFSKNKKKRQYELEIERYTKKEKIATSKEEKEKNRKAIEWYKKELSKIDE